MFIDIGISNRHSENSVEDLPKIELIGFHAKVEESGECLPVHLVPPTPSQK